MEETPDKPPGTEQHPPDEEPARQGPGGEPPRQPTKEQTEPPEQPAPESAPDEEGVSSPER